MIAQLQQKMDTEILQKTQLYKHLETSITNYNNFFENAINTRDEVFYQLREK